MIPKIKYMVHEILTNVFLPPSGDRKEFERNAEEFIKNFKKIEKRVLELIEKFSGFEWTKKNIPVYLIPAGKSVSFAKSNLEKGNPGVVNKIWSIPERSIHIAIHELVHVNQFQSDFYSKENKVLWKKEEKDVVSLEVCTDVVTIHVLRELFGEDSKYEKDYWHFMNNVMTSTPAKKLKIPSYLKKWDLDKKSLREYIFNKN